MVAAGMEVGMVAAAGMEVGQSFEEKLPRPPPRKGFYRFFTAKN